MTGKRTFGANLSLLDTWSAKLDLVRASRWNFADRVLIRTSCNSHLYTVASIKLLPTQENTHSGWIPEIFIF